VLFGWREPPVWLESQGGAYVVVNENLANLIPAVVLVAGAGGVSVDFDGRPLRERGLAAGRTSVIHAANDTLCRQVLALVHQAVSLRHRFGTAP
jgi:fructose-1,6-bisphosphatase/inositol monophosphatase family enzyme